MSPKSKPTSQKKGIRPADAWIPQHVRAAAREAVESALLAALSAALAVGRHSTALPREVFARLDSAGLMTVGDHAAVAAIVGAARELQAQHDLVESARSEEAN